VFNRSIPSDIEDKVQALSQAETLLSKETRWEILGIDTEKEKQRMEEEAAARGAEILEEFDSEVEGVVDIPGAQLNGAQVTAAVGVAARVAAGELTRESGIALLMSIGVSRSEAEKIIPQQGSAEASDKEKELSNA